MRSLLVTAAAAAALLVAPTAGGQQTDDEVQSLVDSIRALADEAERTRAADAPIIGALRELARRYDWPWRTALIDEDFRRGELPESWVIDSGRFSIDPGEGLRSSVSLPGGAIAGAGNAERQEPSGDEDAALAILGNILEQVTRQPGQQQRETGGTRTESTAALHVLQSVPNAFAIEMTLSAQPAQGVMEIGPYQGAARDAGYRLVFAPGSDRPIELLRLGSRGSAVVESVPAGDVDIEAGREHRLLWTRDTQGQMVVSLDDRELIRVIDRGFQDSFQGLVLVNRAGTFTVADLAVHGVPQ